MIVGSIIFISPQSKLLATLAEQAAWRFRLIVIISLKVSNVTVCATDLNSYVVKVDEKSTDILVSLPGDTILFTNTSYSVTGPFMFMN
jgi:hypothetical protein